MTVRQWPEDIVRLRQIRLESHGVRAEFSRELAVSQLDAEAAQAYRDSQRRAPWTEDERFEENSRQKSVKYDGVSAEIAACFDAQMNTPHEPGGSKRKSRREHKKSAPNHAWWNWAFDE